MRAIDPDVTIKVADSHSEEALTLLEAMSQEMADLYQEEGFTNLIPARMDDARSAFVIARWRGRAAGCGAVRPLETNIGELKRIYVIPELRGRGIAQLILATLENLAREFGYRAVRLETGVLQEEAIRLYERVGYHRVSCWGEDAGDPMSICFEKSL